MCLLTIVTLMRRVRLVKPQEDDQRVPSIANRRARDPTRKIFRLSRNSPIISEKSLQVTSFIERPMTEYFWQYVELDTNHGSFLLKKYENPENNELKLELEDQTRMGMWNPRPIDMEYIEELYGSVVYQEDIQSHPNILRQHGVISDSEMVSPLMNIFGTLTERPISATFIEYCQEETPDDEQTLLWAYQMAGALKYCHLEMNIVHRDIRPENLFLFNEGRHVKLGNFFYISPVTLRQETRSGKDLLYTAPEVLPEQLPNDRAPQFSSTVNRYSYSSDVWSLGMVLYYSSHLQVPFEDVYQPEVRLKRLIEEEGKRPPLKEHVDNTLKTLLEACWRTERRDPRGDILPLEKKRPTAVEILRYLDYN